MSNNPLQAYFRQPAISFELPSHGDFWADGALDAGLQQEIDIYPMTAADEITLRTPDMLMNGTAITKLIESCVPNIKDAGKCPITDLEPLLIAIRIASVSDGLDLSVKCPKCKEEHDYDIDLRSALDSIKPGNWKQPLKVGGLEVYFRPLSFEELNVYNNTVFKSQRLAKQIEMLDDDEQKEALSNGIIKEMNTNKVQMLVQSVKGIVMKDELIDNRDFIAEYLMKCDKKTYDQIKERFEELKGTTKAADTLLKCSACEYEFKIPFTLDYSSFFVNGS